MPERGADTRCARCDVLWFGRDRKCWVCGARGSRIFKPHRVSWIHGAMQPAGFAAMGQAVAAAAHRDAERARMVP